jgi:protein involved in polysaccharide export with SLBB domain
MLHTSLSRLRQDKPPAYLLGPGDTLGVFIDYVLGEENQQVPFNESKNDDRPPSSGYPVTIQDDGTIRLPLADPISLQGKTLQEATEKVRKVLIETKVLPEGQQNGRFLITLMRPRTSTVLVVRQEATIAGNGRNITRTTDTQIPGKKGTGNILELPAYENDVLHALNQTGGMPGDDARNEIVIYRGQFHDAEQRDTVLAAINAGLDPCTPKPCDPLDKTVTRIPLTYHPDDPPKFTQQDIVLHDGDILMIEARHTEVFYTGGVLQGQEIAIPRDYDLDVVGAIALAGGQIGGAGTGVGNLGRGGQLNQIRSTNIGVPPSICYVIRKTPGGGQIPIRVNLKKTLIDPNERILIQPGDLVMVQYSFSEEMANAFLGVFSLNYAGNFQGFHEF